MGYQSEAELENQLIKQLNEQGYKTVAIKDYDSLLANFREQFCNFNREKLGSVPLSDKEWDRLLNYMLGRSVFESAKVLRDKYVLERDDNSKVYVSFIDEDHTKNIWQVTHQTTVVGKYTNRYDVTILCNGLPLVQIELKRRGMDLRQAINQIMRYKKHSYIGLYRYIQCFVVSNGVDTKYFSNSDSVVGDRDDETILNENEMGVVINMRSVLKALIIVIVGTVAFCLSLVYFGGIIEQVIEILLYLLCVAGLVAAFILGAQV